MITIILGTAHQKSIQGKCSPDGKFREYKYSREVVKAVCDILQSMGYTTLIDIEDDDLGLSQQRELSLRCSIVNELVKQYKNCIYVSIHVNAAAADCKWHNATGWEVYTSPGKTKSDILATCMWNAAKNYLGDLTTMRSDWSDGDPDKEAKFFVLTKTKCPAVLVENLFMDNKEDLRVLTGDVGFMLIERTIVEGILNYWLKVQSYGKQKR